MLFFFFFSYRPIGGTAHQMLSLEGATTGCKRVVIAFTLLLLLFFFFANTLAAFSLSHYHLRLEKENSFFFSSCVLESRLVEREKAQSNESSFFFPFLLYLLTSSHLSFRGKVGGSPRRYYTLNAQKRSQLHCTSRHTRTSYAAKDEGGKKEGEKATTTEKYNIRLSFYLLFFSEFTETSALKQARALAFI